ncbi:MAG: BON domain-containing protein, partial [Spongiibacter sp.]|uniref:BON domain-containing protein n=1 Tax=Spongiibacter sp. TaxID=2024860 RepID=UPI001B0D084A
RKANDAFSQASIDVNSHNGIVLLTGQVPNEELKRVAAAVADQVKKVRKVHNELVIGEPIHLMARTSDSWLATKVKSRLSLNDELDASRIKVITENGAVYLMGLLSKNESDIAAKVASETTGVQKVIRVFEYY